MIGRRFGPATVALVCVVWLAAVVQAAAITIPEGYVVPSVGAVWSPYLAPIAISDLNFDTETPDDNLWYGQAETLKYSTWQNYDGLLDPGNFGLLDIDQTSSDDGIRDILAMTSQAGVLRVGDYRYAYIGNKVGLFRQGIDGRLDASSYQDGHFDLWADDECPLDSRIMIAPVIEDANINGGSTELEITGFVAFYVDQLNLGPDSLTVRFTSMPEGVMVPEPGSLLALLAGLGGLCAMRRRRGR